MSAPSYDWLSQLTPVQKKFLEDNYPALWHDYTAYGYSVLLYDYVRELDTVYDRVKSVQLVAKVELPEKFTDKVRVFYEKQLEINQVKQIVIPIQNYHVVLIGDDLRLDSELRKSITEVPVVMSKDLTDEMLHCPATAIVFDDVTYTVTRTMLEQCELHAVPYIRRTILGWSEPSLEKDAENALLNFVERHRPCKLIR